MELGRGKEGTSGGSLWSAAEGARLCCLSDREGAWAVAGRPEAGGGEEEKVPAAVKKTEDAEELRMDLAVVKQEVIDWSDLKGDMVDSQWVKQEVEDGPEVKDEKPEVLEVKQEVDSSFVVKEERMEETEVKEEKVKVKEEVMDWPDVKEENLEVKQEEKFAAPNIKEEQMMDGLHIKEEKDFLKREGMDDPKVKVEPPLDLPVGCKRKLALARCETCGTEEAKYRCPRCMRYSCSLPCVKKHKTELTCNGVRDKTGYVSIQQFTEMNLLSDYRFLEDVARTADHISRDIFLKRPTSNKHMFFMKNRARRQGITLKLLPNGFTKRKENSTYFDTRKQQFYWHVKLQFPQSQAEYTEKRVPDDKTINEILKSYIDPEKSDPVIRQRLKAYIRSQVGVQILMKAEHMQQNLLSYYELDPHKSLLDNLRNKVIIEYPTLHIVLKGFSADMKILPQVKNGSTKNLAMEIEASARQRWSRQLQRIMH
ncbi:box C/D snoRNA protein 1 [Perognathus longimembris pacificus]|uniref:box C/D snoRNA protein 1 n=1 Tax=Perognathus longimembris pacificus TaxID=214514 RepID=UPI00201881CD|nr:box C/D snoRNA protein 1 [Perognathus longimembris pacificus]